MLYATVKTLASQHRVARRYHDALGTRDDSVCSRPIRLLGEKRRDEKYKPVTPSPREKRGIGKRRERIDPEFHSRKDMPDFIVVFHERQVSQ